MTQPHVKKIHLGCGEHRLPGWLNADAHPVGEVMYLDVTRKFSFPDNTFDYAYSEHLIEHLGYKEGLCMLAECFRVLRPGGYLRIATPDVAVLFALCADNLSELQKQYLKWMVDTYMPAAAYNGIFVLNYFFRHWEHRFLYDEKALRYSLEQAGFAAIVKCAVGLSRSPELGGLENQQRMPAGFLALETVVLEAMKPVCDA